MVIDHISDMLIRIKNAQAVKKETVAFDYSKVKWDLVKILEKAGYLDSPVRQGKKNKKVIEVKLLYSANGNPTISGMRRISKLSRRVYRGHRAIFPVKNGFGIAIYSTPKGLLTNKEARKERVGGEVLFEVW